MSAPASALGVEARTDRAAASKHGCSNAHAQTGCPTIFIYDGLRRPRGASGPNAGAVAGTITFPALACLPVKARQHQGDTGSGIRRRRHDVHQTSTVAWRRAYDAAPTRGPGTPGGRAGVPGVRAERAGVHVPDHVHAGRGLAVQGAAQHAAGCVQSQRAFSRQTRTPGFKLQQVSTAGAVSASPSGGATSLSCPSKGTPAIVVESESIAFSPDSKVIAEVEQGQGAPGTSKGFLRTYSVSKSGVVTPDECLTDIGGAPPGEGPLYSDAFSPAAEGGLLAVTSIVTNSVYVFSVTGAGKVYPLPGSPFATGKEPDAVTFSPTGSGFDLLATANRGDASVSMFTVGSSVVAPVAGSPFATGKGPLRSRSVQTVGCSRPPTPPPTRCRCSR